MSNSAKQKTEVPLNIQKDKEFKPILNYTATSKNNMSEAITYQTSDKRGGFRSLIVYQKALSLTLEINKMVNQFPQHELYSLTDQIRRSSRSVCSCIGEAYRKRQYPKHFSSKLSDADMENTETQIWLDIAHGCSLISDIQYSDAICKSEEIGRLLSSMIENPEKFAPRNSSNNLILEPAGAYLTTERSFIPSQQNLDCQVPTGDWLLQYRDHEQ